MKQKESLGGRIFDVVNVCLLFLLVLVTLYPIWHVLMASFSSDNAIMSHTGFLLRPKEFTVAAYQAIFRNHSVWSGIKISLVQVIVGTGLSTLLTVMTAYFLTKKDAMLSKLLGYIVVFTMYFSAGLIPMYLVGRSIGLVNSIAALVIPGMISSFNVIVMRSAVAAVPDSLFESAEIDGARHMYIIFRLVIPLCLPTVAVLLLYYSVGYWNSWFYAMVFLNEREKFPLQLLLREVAVANAKLEKADTDSSVQAQETLKYALIVVSTLPVLFIYPFLQKYFVKGIMVGAVKG